MQRFIICLFLAFLAGCASAPSRVCDCTIVATPEIDQAAAKALYSYPKSKNAEYFSGVYAGLHVPEPQVLGRMGGAGGVYANPLAIIHTHPIMESSNWHGNDSARPAPHDIDAVLQIGVPNYFRSHNGRQVFVIEVVDGFATTRAIH